MTPRRSRVAARVAALLLVLCFASGQPPGAQSHEQQSLGAQPQEQQSAGSPATARLVSSTTVPGSPGVFSESYDAALPPAPPGAVQLLFFPFSRPPGSVAVLGLSLELVDTASRAPVPPSQLYVHHYGVDERAGAELANATNWAERLAAGASFWAGPCTSVSYTLGAGAEFRGPNPQLPPWAAGSPLPTAAWRLAPDSDYSIEFHMIDLRQVSDVRSCVQCNCSYYAPLNRDAGLAATPGGAGLQCCPDHVRCDGDGPAPALANVSYSLLYTMTFANDSAAVARIAPLIFSTLSVDSSAQTNGYTCAGEYNPRVCGALPAEPAGAWTGPGSSCGPGPDGATAATVARQEFSWTLPRGYVMSLRRAVGHAHVGSVGVSLYATLPGPGEREQLLCDSATSYFGQADPPPFRGWVAAMAPCGWPADRPLRLPGGTVLRAVAAYHADARPFAAAAFQLPWQGAMGYVNLVHTSDEPGSTFGLPSANGARVEAVAAAGGAPSVCAAAAVPPDDDGGGGGGSAPAPAPAPGPQPGPATLGEGLTLAWFARGDSIRFVLTLATPAAAAPVWFGIGLHSPGAPRAGMLGADMVVASPPAHRDGDAWDVAEYVATAYAAPVRKASLGTPGSGLSLCGYRATPNATIVTFTRPLKGSGDGAADVVPGASAVVVWAVGSSHGLSYHGVRRGATTVVW